MSRQEVVQSHMEVLMANVLGVEQLIVAPDGEVAVSTELGSYSVRVRERDEPHLEVYSVVLTDVDADPGLFEALNDINSRLSHCRAFWYRGRVVIAGELVGFAADEDSLSCLCTEVAHHVDTDGPQLASVFGGKTLAQREEEEDA